MTPDVLSDIRNRKIGFVFQSFNLISRTSALKNVELPMTYARIPKARRTARAKELLERVGLGARKEHMPNELSGGQRQRIGIARALYKQADSLFFDEATSSLDNRTEEGINRAIAELARENRNLTIVIIAHRDSSLEYCDRIINLESPWNKSLS